jgi:hypothetical protein
MLDPQHLTTLWASKTCYRKQYFFTLLLLLGEEGSESEGIEPRPSFSFPSHCGLYVHSPDQLTHSCVILDSTNEGKT